MDNTWEIMQIVNHFNNAVKDIETYTPEYKEIEKLYAQAIRLQCKQDFGYVMTKDDFWESVCAGGFTNYDGFGIYLNWEGNECYGAQCNPKLISQSQYPFVVWFNK